MNNIRIWIPLFLVWLVLIMLSPAIALACVIANINAGHALRTLGSFTDALYGTVIHVGQGRRSVSIQIS